MRSQHDAWEATSKQLREAFPTLNDPLVPANGPYQENNDWYETRDGTKVLRAGRLSPLSRAGLRAAVTLHAEEALRVAELARELYERLVFRPEKKTAGLLKEKAPFQGVLWHVGAPRGDLRYRGITLDPRKVPPLGAGYNTSSTGGYEVERGTRHHCIGTDNLLEVLENVIRRWGKTPSIKELRDPYTPQRDLFFGDFPLPCLELYVDHRRGLVVYTVPCSVLFSYCSPSFPVGSAPNGDSLAFIAHCMHPDYKLGVQGLEDEYDSEDAEDSEDDDSEYSEYSESDISEGPVTPAQPALTAPARPQPIRRGDPPPNTVTRRTTSVAFTIGSEDGSEETYPTDSRAPARVRARTAPARGRVPSSEIESERE